MASSSGCGAGLRTKAHAGPRRSHSRPAPRRPDTGPARTPLDARDEHCKLRGTHKCNETQRFRDASAPGRRPGPRLPAPRRHDPPRAARPSWPWRSPPARSPGRATAARAGTGLDPRGVRGAGGGHLPAGWGAAPPVQDAATRARLEADLAAARARHDSAPADADRIIWLGRAQATWAATAKRSTSSPAASPCTRTTPACSATAATAASPSATSRAPRPTWSAPRSWCAAARTRRSSTAPPTASASPPAPLQSNVWYHLGLARYLRADFAGALDAYREAMRVAANPDMLVATSDCLYMTLRRLGRDAEAARVLGADLPRHAHPGERGLPPAAADVPGRLPPDSLLAGGADPLTVATQGYGVGNWYLYNGYWARAMQVFGGWWRAATGARSATSPRRWNWRASVAGRR